MAIQLACTQCGKQYNLKIEFAGKKVRCKCGNAFQVPFQENVAVLPPVVPDYWASRSKPKKKSAKSKRQSQTGDFRSIDVIYMAVSGIAVLFALYSVLNIFSSIPMLFGAGLPAREGLPPEFTETLNEINGRLMISSLLGLVGGVTSMSMGAAGAGIIAFINETRTKGKSELEWTLTAGAVASVLSILISFALIFMLFTSTASVPRGFNVGLRFAFQLPFLLLSNALPVAMIGLLVFKKKLD